MKKTYFSLYIFVPLQKFIGYVFTLNGKKKLEEILPLKRNWLRFYAA